MYNSSVVAKPLAGFHRTKACFPARTHICHSRRFLGILCQFCRLNISHTLFIYFVYVMIGHVGILTPYDNPNVCILYIIGNNYCMFNGVSGSDLRHVDGSTWKTVGMQRRKNRWNVQDPNNSLFRWNALVPFIWCILGYMEEILLRYIPIVQCDLESLQTCPGC